LRIAEIKPGGIVGEMALIEGKPRSANVRAIQDSTVLSLARAKYEEFKDEQPAVATKLQDELLRLFSNRLRQTTEKMMGKI
jgi:CRP-like cAMP-binding protein